MTAIARFKAALSSRPHRNPTLSHIDSTPKAASYIMALRVNLGLSNISSQQLRASGVYLSGALYASAFYLILDSALWSKHKNPSGLHIGFVDWIPLLLGSLGMAVINLVEKSRLNSGVAFSSEYAGSPENWQAKVVLFMGFAFLSGSLAGSIVILVLRYLIHHHSMPVLGMGVSNVLSSISIMVSCASLWIAQNLEDDYSYSLQI